jgi:hypothetical protein
MGLKRSDELRQDGVHVALASGLAGDGLHPPPINTVLTPQGISRQKPQFYLVGQ